MATKTTLRNVKRGDPIAIIYIPSATLARYGAGVAANGTFMVFDVIPFYEVKSIWIGKSNGGRRLEYADVKRAYSKCVENATHPKSRQRCSSRTSQRSARGWRRLR